MFKQTVDERLLLVLERLSRLEEIVKKFYLAGGTALSLLMGHRKSDDIDLFTIDKFDVMLYSNLLMNNDGVVNQTANQTIHGSMQNIKVSLLYFPYELIDKENQKEIFNIPLASIRDIACMKLLAITQRGEKKDFYDLYEIFKTVSLAELKISLEKKFGRDKLNLYSVARAFTYFDEAENSPVPDSLNHTKWDDVKNYFLKNEKQFTGILLD